MSVPNFVYGAGCSTANLIRCLDSSCAINIGANPAARCQYCGSSSAGEPEKSMAMKSVSAGSAAKYTISDKELKKAPEDAGERYVWTIQKCLSKMPECTNEDVEDNYDSLIEQSCKAAGIAADFSSLAKKVNTAKTKGSCSTDISACIINDKHCLAGYRKCESDEDFDRHFSDCGIINVGCDAFLQEIRSTLIAARDKSFKNADEMLQKIVLTYQNARKQTLDSTIQSCRDNSAKEKCMNSVCNSHMRNKCEVGYEYEKVIANELCKFYDIACSRLQ